MLHEDNLTEEEQKIINTPTPPKQERLRELAILRKIKRPAAYLDYLTCIRGMWRYRHNKRWE